MTIDQKKEADLFIAALELPTLEERRAYVRGACEGDDGLYQRVLLLMESHDQSQGPLDNAPIATDETRSFQQADEDVGQQIGPYKLREKIGEGGFGVVYVAEQKEPVSRKVALKVIKPGMDSREIIARFEAERQALAMMDHPNVAKVLDAGATESGRPYFVMELVRGVAITEYCDSKKLTNRGRLELFIDVCHAVQHAHQKGIIHRDLKPSNIMVTMADHRPVVKVIDFGVSKALHHELTDKSIYTGYGQMIGTPMYMSPEQAQLSSLDIDTRSDIYSLGVLLYELLTGTTPFDKETFKKAGFDEMRRMIREMEPRRPSDRVSTLKAEQISTISDSRDIDQGSLSKALRGDLDCIAMKALEKDRSRRYETADAMAQDIQRFLNDEPVLACPPSSFYRFRKFAKREKVALAFAALLTLFLVTTIVGLGVSNTMLSVREKQTLTEKKKADESLKQALEANQRADANFQQLTKSNRILTSIFNDLDIREIRGSSETLEVVLARRLSDSASNLNDLQFNDPSAKAEMAIEIGEAMLSLGFFQQAYEVLDDASKSLSGQISPRDPVVLECLLAKGEARLKMGKYRDSVALSKQVISAIDSPDPQYESINARAHQSLAAGQRKLGQWDLALLASEQAVVLCRQANLPERELADAKAQFALCCAAAGKYDEAIPLLEEAVEIMQILYGPTHIQTSDMSHALAQTYENVSRYDDAIEIMESTVELRSEQLGVRHPFTIAANVTLGNLYLNSGKISEGVALLEEGLELRALLLNDSHPKTLIVLNDLAGGYRIQGNYEQAIELLEEALFAMRRVLGPEHPTTQVCMNNLALNLKLTGNLKRAIELWRQCLDVRLVEFPDHPDTLTMIKNLALGYLQTDELDEALELLRTVLEKEEAQFGSDHARCVITINSIAGAYRRMGKLELAEQYYEEALRMAENLEPPNSRLTLGVMQSYAAWQWRQGKLDKSIPIFEKILERRQSLLSEHHPDVIAAMANLGVNYKDGGKLMEGVRLLEEACELDAEHRRFPFILSQLMDGYVKADRIEDAAQVAEEYLDLANNRWSPDSASLANAVNDVSQLYLIPIENWERAESLLRRALDIRTELLEGKREVFETQQNLGTTLVKLERFEEAEQLLLSAHHGLLKHKDKTAPRQLRIRESLERLVELYESWTEADHDTNALDEAEHWKKELEKYDQESNRSDN